MQTIYVDIYFLINFTVDLLSLHIASCFTKIKVSAFGILVSSIVGGLYAVFLVFLPQKIYINLIGTVLFFSFLLFLCVRGCRFIRKVKFIIAFLLTQIIIGGTVYFSYGIIERSLKETDFIEVESSRNLLVLSLVVLLSIGVLKILLMLFKNNFSEKNVKIKMVVFEKEYEIDALVDSGNFAIDPMDNSPIMLVKPSLAEKIFPYGIPDIYEAQAISEKIRKRVRIIPISTALNSKILLGLRPDSVFVLNPRGCEKINLTIAFDKEGGSFAGFEALIPLIALENI